MSADPLVEELRRELEEAREQQRATTEILSVISRAPTDTQSVFDTIAASAARLCDGLYSVVFRFDGEMITVAADSAQSTRASAIIRSAYPAPPGKGTLASRALLERRVIAVPDAQDSVANPDGAERARDIGYRAGLSVPMLRGDAAIGAINVVRREAIPFTGSQVELLKAFADQAVIAIENARLFEAEQARTRELTESLEYQTVIGGILSVISRAPNNAQPVFDEIVRSASRLCGGEYAIVTRYDGERLHLVGQYNPRPGAADEVAQFYPLVPRRGSSVIGLAILDARVIHVPDVHAELVEPSVREYFERIGLRAIIAMPMMHEGRPIGVISVSRSVAGAFSDQQIKLLSTFADQAVIAIENARLFNETQEALERQTATANILRVISSSPTDVKPVFEAILDNASRLCDSQLAAVFRFDGTLLHLVATKNWPEDAIANVASRWPMPPDPQMTSGRVVLQKGVVLQEDTLADPSYDHSTAHADGWRRMIGVPMLRNRDVIGVIVLTWQEPGKISPRQVGLLEGFADQAVIAIENTRLFEEVQQKNRALIESNTQLTEALEQQTASSEILRVISTSPTNLQPVLDTVVKSAARFCGAPDASIFRLDGGNLRADAHHGPVSQPTGFLVPVVRGTAAGRAVLERRAVHVTDLQAEIEEFPEGSALSRQIGQRAMLVAPLLREGAPTGVIVLRRTEAVPFTDKQITLLKTFADQAVIAIENTRLFEEVQARTRELAKTVEDLEIASAHKSQFVANMSHELRTPLAAILGYAELMQEGFYEPLGQKSLDALTRIRSNGKHLLGLINTVLDIAKIESGQFTLSMAEYAVEGIVETVRGATELLAETKKLAFKTDMAKTLPIGLGDEQRLTQVLLNLVGNAIKFTDAGEVRVTASAADSHFTVSVADTGPGIPADQLTRVFEQFHQVDSSNTKAKGGTGLGLAISKQIVEMHGGRIWVELIVGKGSTFHMELPVRAAIKGAA